MRSLLLLLALSGVEGLLLPGPQAVKASSHPEDWELAWSDEFDGKDLDKDKWKHVTGGHGFGNNELQFYTDRADNAYIESGALVIKAQAEKFQNRNHTSAKLQSKVAWTYGRFEFKAKLTKGKGVWPAIWMMPSDMKKYGGWPQCGEIDIVEQLGHEPNRVYGTLHFGNPHPPAGKGASVQLKQGSLVDDWHEYALEWLPGEIRWFVDGELYQVQNDWFTSGGDKPPFPAPYDRDFYLQLNVAVGGGWPGNPDASTVFPQVMKFDYIRVFKPKKLPEPRAKGGPKPEMPPLKAWESRK